MMEDNLRPRVGGPAAQARIRAMQAQGMPHGPPREGDARAEAARLLGYSEELQAGGGRAVLAEVVVTGWSVGV
jgi:hypothetical protein